MSIVNSELVSHQCDEYFQPLARKSDCHISQERAVILLYTTYIALAGLPKRLR